jgi:hypothetical protein
LKSHSKIKKLKTLFLYFKKINKQEWVCDERKIGIANEFQIFFIPTVEMLPKEIQSLCNFSFLNFLKIEPANKVQIYFLERDAFSAPKTLLFISFTSLIGME